MRRFQESCGSLLQLGFGLHAHAQAGALLPAWVAGCCGRAFFRARDLGKRQLAATISRLLYLNNNEYNRRVTEHTEDERTETTIAQKQCAFFPSVDK